MKSPSPRFLAGLAAGIAIGVATSAAAANPGAISQLFSLVNGSENGASVSNAYRLDGAAIKDKTITKYEIADGAVGTGQLSADAQPDNLGDHTAEKDLNMSGKKVKNAACVGLCN